MLLLAWNMEVQGSCCRMLNSFRIYISFLSFTWMHCAISAGGKFQCDIIWATKGRSWNLGSCVSMKSKENIASFTPRGIPWDVIEAFCSFMFSVCILQSQIIWLKTCWQYCRIAQEITMRLIPFRLFQPWQTEWLHTGDGWEIHDVKRGAIWGFYYSSRTFTFAVYYHIGAQYLSFVLKQVLYFMFMSTAFCPIPDRVEYSAGLVVSK